MNSSKYWVFDLDGTLVDSFSHYFDTLREMFNKFQVKYTESDIERSLSMHGSKYLAHYFDPEQVKYVSAKIQRQSERDSNKIKIFPDLIDALNLLKDSGAKMAIWTGRDLTSATMILRNNDLSDYFDLCIGGTCVSKHKPHPEGLHRIFEHWGCGPESAVMVGDHDVDMAGAKESQVFAVRVSWAVANAKVCPIADKQFHKVEQFNGWLKDRKTL